MTDFVFPPPAIPSVSIHGSEKRFPVRRIICVGRNYAAHAREMGKDPDREPPFFFYKPSDAVIDSGSTLPYPTLTTNLHYEIELVVAIGREAFKVDKEDALEHVFGYAVGLDMTRRDLQLQARDMGRPWDWGKGFDQSAPCGPLFSAGDVGHPESGRIWLAVNGKVQQDSDLSDLIWSVPDVISTVSKAMRLMPGDLIYTGTPAGVGPVIPGDHITGGVAGLGEISLHIANA